jgi:hypothetical protein
LKNGFLGYLWLILDFKFRDAELAKRASSKAREDYSQYGISIYDPKADASLKTTFGINLNKDVETIEKIQAHVQELCETAGAEYMNSKNVCHVKLGSHPECFYVYQFNSEADLNSVHAASGSIILLFLQTQTDFGNTPE